MLKGKVSGAKPLSGKVIPRGMDGVSPVVGIEEIEGGYRISISDISGTNIIDLMHGADGYTPVKGKDYFDGKQGNTGEPGYTPVKGVDYFDGVNGKDGKDGVTPVVGIDYFTEADKAAIISEVLSSLPVYNGEVVAV